MSRPVRLSCRRSTALTSSLCSNNNHFPTITVRITIKTVTMSSSSSLADSAAAEDVENSFDREFMRVLWKLCAAMVRLDMSPCIGFIVDRSYR